MVSYRRLLAAVEAALLTPNPAPHHRADLSHALHVCLPDFQAFLKYPVSGSFLEFPLRYREFYCAVIKLIIMEVAMEMAFRGRLLEGSYDPRSYGKEKFSVGEY